MPLPPVFVQKLDTRRYAWMGVVIAGGLAISPDDVAQCMDEKNDDVGKKSVKAGTMLINEYRVNPDLEWLCVDRIVTDPANRDGEMIKINDCLEKAQGIETLGFDYSKVRIILVGLGKFH
jgi:hypothetical protein